MSIPQQELVFVQIEWEFPVYEYLSLYVVEEVKVVREGVNAMFGRDLRKVYFAIT
jgi:hypothetical protein